MAYVKINRSGAAVPIYESNALADSTRIGTLYNNEVYTFVEPWNGNGFGYSAMCILFRTSSGELKYGWIAAEDGTPLMTNLTDRAKFTRVIDGTTYYGFTMRREEAIFSTSEGYLRSINAGNHILCKSSTAGQKHPGRLAVWYILTAGGSLQRIVSGSYAFLDMSFDEGTMFNSNFCLIGKA